MEAQRLRIQEDLLARQEALRYRQAASNNPTALHQQYYASQPQYRPGYGTYGSPRGGRRGGAGIGLPLLGGLAGGLLLGEALGDFGGGGFGGDFGGGFGGF